MADRYLLETGAPDGYQLEDGSGVLLLEEQGAQPTVGWLSPLSVAPKRRWCPQPELRAFGVTVAAAAAIATGWWQPLSAAVPRPPVHTGSTFVPFDTRQVNTQFIDKWLVPLSVPAPIPYAAPQGGSTWTGQPLAGNNVDLSKWQQPLGKAAARPPVWPGQSFVPFDTAQIIQNTVTIDKWQQPLSQAVPIPPVWAGDSFVPLNTAQVVAAANVYGWLSPASVAPSPLPVVQPELRPFAAKQTVEVATPTGWQQPLSRAVDRPPVRLGSTSVPYNTAQVVVAANYGWWPVSEAAPTPPPRPPQQSVSIAYPLPDDQHIRWHQPLSRAVTIYRTAPQGWTFVPFDTAPVFAATQYGWWPATSKAPPPRPLIQPELRPFAAILTVETAVYGWWQPLSRAVAIPYTTFTQGQTFVPYNTAQVVAANYGWWPELSRAAPRPPVQQGGPSYTFLSTQFTQNTVYWGNYQQPLSQAAPARPVWQGGAFWIGQPLAGNNVDLGKWQQPLSRPADRPPVWQGTSAVPFDTAQVIFNTIDYSLYQQPLSRAVPIPYTTFTQGWTFTPFDTTQVEVSAPGRAPVAGLWPPQSELDRQWRRRQKQEIAEVEVEIAEVKAETTVFDEQSEIDEIAEIREIYDLIRNTKRRPD